MRINANKHAEHATIASALLLFLFFPWICRSIDITSAPIDPGALSAPIMALLSFFIFKAATWWSIRIIWPVFAEYCEVYFETDFKRLAPREKMLTFLAVYMLLLMGFILTLGAVL